MFWFLLLLNLSLIINRASDLFYFLKDCMEENITCRNYDVDPPSL